MVFAGRERKAGGVLYVPLLQLLVRVDGERYRLSNLADSDSGCILYLPQDVDVRLVLILYGGGVNLRARDDERDWDIELAVIQPEVERLQIDGDICGGHVATHLFGEGKLSVFGLGVLEVGGRVVAGPVLELRLGMVQQVDGQMPIAAIACRVGRVDADDVVGLAIVLDLLEGRAEVVRIDEQLAAGIARERAQRLLRAEVRVQLTLHGRAAIRACAALASLRCVAHRIQRLQTARVDRIQRRVRLHTLVRRRADARLVLDTLPR